MVGRYVPTTKHRIFTAKILTWGLAKKLGDLSITINPQSLSATNLGSLIWFQLICLYLTWCISLFLFSTC